MEKKIKKTILSGVVSLFLISGLSTTTFASSRDYISIVGSSTVYPFATVVAEKFGKSTRFKTPKIESTGSGGGMKLFCSGIGVQHPDITNSSHRIKKSELEKCQGNGVKDIVEVKIGYDGIVLSNSKRSPVMKITSKEIFMALAKEVPASDGAEKVIPNPHKTWKDINSSLPDVKIEVLGPPPTSGTRDAFAELALEGGCKTFPWVKALKKKDKNKYKRICHTVREDGAYVEAGENDNLIIQKLESNPDAFGVFGFSFLDQNIDKIQGSFIDGGQPTFDAIANGDYAVSRPLYFYVKKDHVAVIPGMKEFLGEFSSDKAWGPDGYLSDKGLIPMPDEERKSIAQDVKNLSTLKGL